MVRALAGITGCLIVAVCYGSDLPAPTTDPAANTASSPSTPPPAAPPANAAPAQAATTTAQAASPQQPTTQFDDHNLRAKGYQVKMINGEKYYCRREDVLGTRLQGALQCTEAEELRRRYERSQQTVEQTQRNFSRMPDGGKP
jgi:hypothetical protein